ncbi:MAG: asparagine synthase (glutamine-hydrolyzing) [Planctomycetes bacterium]|nr:asparagine synthase (glutamine-hydrolyzing) [Planctomycetota bacterium]
MCGILGIIRRGPVPLADELRRGMESIKHRGPDDRGVWETFVPPGPVGGDRGLSLALGHLRLAIFDLSPAGHQPMAGAAGEVIVFNGEIYNHVELRAELEMAGHHFATRSDTEVILAAHQHWGDAAPERFLGMWAYAIWDGRRLLLSRDRFGKKPLYLFHDARVGLVAFASEIKALRPVSGVTWAPDQETVFRYLSFAEMESGGRTFFHDVREFPAASVSVFDPAAWTWRERRFWRIDPDRALDLPATAAAAQAREMLADSTRLRLRSDAAVGLALSGGLDSTLLLALANEAGSRALPVFSSGYVEPGYDETDYIAAATRALSCEPNGVRADAARFAREFPDFVHHLDQPSRLPGPYSQWCVAAMAGGKVKVLVDGQGADELAGGYMHFLPAAWRGANMAGRLFAAPGLLATAWANRGVLAQYPAALVWERIRGRPSARRALPLRPAWTAGFATVQPAWGERGADLNALLRRALTETSLPPLLRYGDRVTMAHGVENRCPFLDHRLVEFVAALPASVKIRGGATKWLFRRAALGLIPERIRRRRLKLGFPTPVGAWLRGSLVSWAAERLSGRAESAWYHRWVDAGAARAMLDEHVAGRRDHQALLWRLLCLGEWLAVNQLG